MSDNRVVLAKLAEIEALLLMILERIDAMEENKPIEGVDRRAFDKAIRAARAGDPKPLNSYLARGGKVPRDNEPK